MLNDPMKIFFKTDAESMHKGDLFKKLPDLLVQFYNVI